MKTTHDGRNMFSDNQSTIVNAPSIKKEEMTRVYETYFKPLEQRSIEKDAVNHNGGFRNDRLGTLALRG